MRRPAAGEAPKRGRQAEEASFSLQREQLESSARGKCYPVWPEIGIEALVKKGLHPGAKKSLGADDPILIGLYLSTGTLPLFPVLYNVILFQGPSISSGAGTRGFAADRPPFNSKAS